MTDAPKRIWTDYSVGLYGHIIDHKNPGHAWDRDATPYVRADIADDMLEAMKAAIDCGMVPKSSVADGGAVRHSRYVQVGDRIRAAIAKAEGGEG